MKVFRIEFETNKFQSLLPADEEVRKSRLLALDGSSRRLQWPQEALMASVDNARAIAPDIYSLSAGGMVMARRAESALVAHFSENCELLPVKWESDSGVLVNVIGTDDVLDEKNTIWQVDEESGKKLFIERYEFCYDKIPRKLLFKVPHQRFQTFCSDQGDGKCNLPALIKEARLSGVRLCEVWRSA